ncbi:MULTISPECIES: GAF domain-containing protein [Okeania]|nr:MULTISPECIES: GAF domain-containing protein [Okeania]NEP05131.1 GAF domain-containing protein [Okeania sp. SIO4D6]NEP40262.1 GAF domain-containing protein [Okeania sp. SIO2H7]NEP73542.1 GAF domain-containing protein [Okeania sp. SIO2G5]NEP96948.1 GAF domain-containing protein [Okeania sp. SIO2F5]NEQ92198.1 GAF domain-containing protein [Okeania sp. SIO2G4]
MNETITISLEKICVSTDFPYGEAWIPDEDKNLLQLSSSYYIDSGFGNKDLEQFWVCSQDFILSRGEGLPGRVWLSKQPEWIIDVTIESEGYFLRNQIAKAFGVKSGFSVPVITQNKVLIVLAFFTAQTHSKDTKIIEIATSQAESLGKFLLHL